MTKYCALYYWKKQYIVYKHETARRRCPAASHKRVEADVCRPAGGHDGGVFFPFLTQNITNGDGDKSQFVRPLVVNVGVCIMLL